MCGQFDGLLAYAQFMALLGMAGPEDMRDGKSVKVAPTLSTPVIVEAPEDRTLGVMPMRFGLVPHWYRGSLAEWKASTFNARVEEAGMKPVFKSAWAYRHCIVPAEAFYEWSGPKGDRTKWRITRADNQPLAFAGLWDEAMTQQGEVFSFAILTRAAGADMLAIHTREPIVLPPEAWEPWLRRQAVDLRQATALKIVNQTAPTLF